MEHRARITVTADTKRARRHLSAEATAASSCASVARACDHFAAGRTDQGLDALVHAEEFAALATVLGSGKGTPGDWAACVARTGREPTLALAEQHGLDPSDPEVRRVCGCSPLEEIETGQRCTCGSDLCAACSAWERRAWHRIRVMVDREMERAGCSLRVTSVDERDDGRVDVWLGEDNVISFCRDEDLVGRWERAREFAQKCATAEMRDLVQATATQTESGIKRLTEAAAAAGVVPATLGNIAGMPCGTPSRTYAKDYATSEPAPGTDWDCPVCERTLAATGEQCCCEPTLPVIRKIVDAVLVERGCATKVSWIGRDQGTGWVIVLVGDEWSKSLGHMCFSVAEVWRQAEMLADSLIRSQERMVSREPAQTVTKDPDPAAVTTVVFHAWGEEKAADFAEALTGLREDIRSGAETEPDILKAAPHDASTTSGTDREPSTVAPWQAVVCVHCKTVFCENAECLPEDHPHRVEVKARSQQES